MNEIVTDRHRIIFKHLSYFNRLIETIILSNNTVENKAIAIKRFKHLTKSVISHVKSK
jgi:hypothetical protein